MRRFFFASCSVLVVLLSLTFFFRPITSINEDLGRHILLVSIIVNSFEVPSTNLLSFTHPDHPFINTTWMSAVFFYAITKIGGFDLLLLSTTTIVLLSFSILAYFVGKRYQISAVLLSSGIYLLLVMNRSDVRPEIFSIFFLSLFCYILFSFREKFTKKVYWLIPLEVLWVNFHVYFFVGVLLVLFFLIDQLLSEKKITHKAKKLGLVLMGVIAATFINPNFFDGALYPLFIFTNYGFPVTENQNIILLFEVYNSLGIYYPLIIFGCAFALLLLFRKRFRIIDWLLILFFGISMVFLYRNILLFAIITFIPFVRLMHLSINKMYLAFRYLPKAPFLMFYFIAPLFLGCLITWSITTHSFGFGVVDRSKGAIDFLEEHGINGPYFNDSDTGGYLSYRVYPAKVFIDGRPEAFPSSFFRDEYFPMLMDFDMFNKVNAKYEFNAIVLKHADGFFHTIPLYYTLVRSERFALVYLDDYAMVFVKNNSRNNQLIERYRIHENTIDFKNVKNSEMLLRYLSVAGKTGWENMGNRVIEQLQLIDPRLCRLDSYRNRLKQLEYFDASQIQRCHYLPMSIY